MFAATEEKLIVGVLAFLTLLAGVLGFIHHERKQGATVCVQQDQSAALAQSKKETADALSVVTTLDAQLAAIASTPTVDAPMRMCNVKTGSVSPRPTTRSVKPAAIPHISTSTSVQAGVEPGVDIGPSVQDITLSCMLGIADATDLWNLAVKESAGK
jgi:hypothetical protein